MNTHRPTYEHVDHDNLFVSVLVGSGITASVTVAIILQTLYQGSYVWGIPVAACAGLAFGWTVAYPAARLLVRRLCDAPGDIASAAAIGLSILLSVPACFFAPAIGLGSFIAAILFLGFMAGIGGLFLGGYMVQQS